MYYNVLKNVPKTSKMFQITTKYSKTYDFVEEYTEKMKSDL